jgi:ATP-dependent Lon protease
MPNHNINNFPQTLPVVIEESIFLYPFMIAPLFFLPDDQNIESIDKALENDSTILVLPTKTSEIKRDVDSIYQVGVVGTIMRKVPLPDGRIKILFQGLHKAKVVKFLDTELLNAMVDKLSLDEFNDLKVSAALEILREKVRNLATAGDIFPPELLKTIESNYDPDRIVDLIASTIRLKRESAHKLFSLTNLEDRLILLIEYISISIDENNLKKKIKSKVHSKIDKVNKEYFLKEQLKQIQKELGIDNSRDEEMEEYRKKLNYKKDFMSKDAYKEIKKQIDRLSKMHSESSDASMIEGYLDWVLDIPFGQISKKRLDIAEVAKTMNKDHYSLEKPKERIEEYFAVRELKAKRGIKDKIKRGEILCFVGPPGVGKTSLANSIATALKRKLVRIALGGLEDVNELRGHRRTYIGAMPGRVVQGLIEAKEMDPVIVLDEIDKISRNYRGDPTAVLLEILDPEQNVEYRDYFLNFNIDLSQAIFIATANDASLIPAPLRDRMEFIQISSYTPTEKLQIASKYLIPQELKKHGLKKGEFNITSAALELLISNYTREAGVRSLRRQIAKILRKVAKEFLLDSSINKIGVTVKNIKKYLEKEVFTIDEIDRKNQVGITNGLAWTSVGGDILQIESSKILGKGDLILTGSLGSVMKESVKIAHSVVKTLIDSKSIKIDQATDNDSAVYKKYDLHIHVPEGATPKDGPSAGIAMATVISSILVDREVRSDVAMTGELTLSGKVLPIGGLKEKLIAAHKAKIKIALIPQKNYDRDLDDIPEVVKRSIDIVGVERVEDVLKVALVD